MSDDTRTALEAAIAAHVADERDGNLVTDWVLLTASVGADMRRTDYLDACSENSPGHALEGLILHGHRRLLKRENDDDE